jgi:hypothetical protein
MQTDLHHGLLDKGTSRAQRDGAGGGTDARSSRSPLSVTATVAAVSACIGSVVRFPQAE